VCRHGRDCGELLKVIVFRGSFYSAMPLAVNKLDSKLVLQIFKPVNIVDADLLSSVI
jgi:hypothetical protein